MTVNQQILLSGGGIIVSSKEEAKRIRKECSKLCKARYRKCYDGKYCVDAIM